MNLSPHFTLAELTVSDTAPRMGIDNMPGTAELAALHRLCALILEPLREAIGTPIRVTSGYRSMALNTMIGGARRSQHIEGRAADIQVAGMSPLEVCRKIKALGLPYAQCIHEFGAWCHVSVALDAQAAEREDLTAVRRCGKVVYECGLMEVA